MIIVVARLKNSADIIENWIRGNGVYADKFIVIDNESVDGTIQILKLLKSEGYDIEILKPENCIERQKNQMNWLIRYAADAYDPDWILPLDDDEILASDKAIDIKMYLNELQRCGKAGSRQFKVRWRIYAWTGRENENLSGITARMGYCFINNYYDYPTVLMTRELVKEGYQLTVGNHALVDVKKRDLETIWLDDLYLAHYPIRSKGQVISKFTVGWINDFLTNPLSKHMKEDKCNYWREIYEEYKRNRDIVDDDFMRKIMGFYRRKTYIDKVNEIVWKPVGLPSSAFEVKYGCGNVDYIYNFMCNTEILAREIAKMRKQMGQEDFDYDFYIDKQDF
jgi:hypothetical protein